MAASSKKKTHVVLSPKEKRKLRELLVLTRERIGGQVTALQHDSLQRFDEVNSEEDGTDAFERQFALNLAGTEQESLFLIDKALRSLDEGTYGVCETCERPIEKARLKALPFVSMCLKCQAEMEHGSSGIQKHSYAATTPAEADMDNSVLASDDE